jgi:hypothetical protein
MLPILRLIPVGGVALAIVLLVLALSAPDDSRLPLPRAMMPARGALIASADHPEWPQLLVNAALRRADELNQLRYLPDNPVRSDPKPEHRKTEKKTEKTPEVAGVPNSQNDAEPQDVTKTGAQPPEAAIPVDIGEASSTELPVSQEKERPPVTKTPQRNNPTRQSENVEPPKAAKPAAKTAKPAPEPAKPARRVVRRSRRAKPAAEQQFNPAQFNFLAAFFASFNVPPQPPPAAPRQR